MIGLTMTEVRCDECGGQTLTPVRFHQPPTPESVAVEARRLVCEYAGWTSTMDGVEDGDEPADLCPECGP